MANLIKEIITHPIEWIDKETKRHASLRYLFLLFVLVLYFLYCFYKFGAKDGLLITALTWSFFVFCTPIADAGFLLDFPIRLITGLRMLYSEMMVWTIATLLNLYAFFFVANVYQDTLVLKVFYDILTVPLNWSVIVVSAIGTYLSIYFADELIDTNLHSEREKYHKHINKWHFILFVFLLILIFILYNFILKEMGINLL